MSEQKAVLEDINSRRVFQQVRDDTSSIIVLHDSSSYSSLVTRITGVSSIWSRTFSFDGELFISKVYQSAIRALTSRGKHQLKEPDSLMIYPEEAYLYDPLITTLPIALGGLSNFKPLALDTAGPLSLSDSATGTESTQGPALSQTSPQMREVHRT